MNKKAQSYIEYSVIIAVIVGALIAMSVYMKRGLQGNLRNSAMQISEGQMYSPGATNSDSTTTTTINENSGSANGTSTSSTRMTQIIERDEGLANFTSEPGRL